MAVVNLPWKSPAWPEIAAILSSAILDSSALELALEQIAGDISFSGSGSFFRDGFDDDGDDDGDDDEKYHDDNQRQEQEQETEGLSFAAQLRLRARHEQQNVPFMTRRRFFDVVLPFMQEMALTVGEIMSSLYGATDIPILQPRIDSIVALPRDVVCGLLSHLFFCTFDGPAPERRIRMAEGAPRTWAFNEFSARSILVGRGDAKLRCLLHYFDRCAPEKAGGKPRVPLGDIVFHRQCMPLPVADGGTDAAFEHWKQSTKLLPQRLVATEDVIERFLTLPASSRDLDQSGRSPFPALTHADFANEYIGGGVLEGGCVQEEILFVIKPECLVSLLITPRMEDLPISEAVILTGCEQFSRYSGYARSFEFAGDFVDEECPRIEQSSSGSIWRAGTLRRHIYAFDATINWSGKDVQFRGRTVVRDLMKAIVAVNVTQPFPLVRAEDASSPSVFAVPVRDADLHGHIAPGSTARLVMPHPTPMTARPFMLDVDPRTVSEDAIVTAGWGCGAFGGDRELKACQQIVAAALVGRPAVIYSSFRDEHFRARLGWHFGILLAVNATVGTVLSALEKYALLEFAGDSLAGSGADGLFEFIEWEVLGGGNAETLIDKANSDEIQHGNIVGTHVSEIDKASSDEIQHALAQQFGVLLPADNVSKEVLTWALEACIKRDRARSLNSAPDSTATD